MEMNCCWQNDHSFWNFESSMEQKDLILLNVVVQWNGPFSSIYINFHLWCLNASDYENHPRVSQGWGAPGALALFFHSVINPKWYPDSRSIWPFSLVNGQPSSVRVWMKEGIERMANMTGRSLRHFRGRVLMQLVQQYGSSRYFSCIVQISAYCL